jgi:type VI protein secretion system component VasK
MIIVALVLVVACALVILGAIFGDPSAVVSLAFFELVDVEVTSIGAFLIGVVTGAVSLVSLWLMVAALRRARHKSVERRQMEKRHDELEKEKVELERKLGRDRQPSEVTDPEPVRSEPYGLSTQPKDADPR